MWDSVFGLIYFYSAFLLRHCFGFIGLWESELTFRLRAYIIIENSHNLILNTQKCKIKQCSCLSID